MHRLLVIGAATLIALVLTGPAGAWTWPADGAVLRPFALGADAYAAGQHRGIDVGGPEGSPARAPASGTVTFVGSLPTHGRGVTILTSDGYAVTLVHLGSATVAKGDVVEEGSPIGTMGFSGDAEHAVPSVHLGIRVASQDEGYIDPLGLLPARPSPTAAPSSPAPSPAPTVVPATAPAPPPVSPPPASVSSAAPSPPPVSALAGPASPAVPAATAASAPPPPVEAVAQAAPSAPEASQSFQASPATDRKAGTARFAAETQPTRPSARPPAAASVTRGSTGSPRPHAPAIGAMTQPAPTRTAEPTGLRHGSVAGRRSEPIGLGEVPRRRDSRTATLSVADEKVAAATRGVATADGAGREPIAQIAEDRSKAAGRPDSAVRARLPGAAAAGQSRPDARRTDGRVSVARVPGVVTGAARGDGADMRAIAAAIALLAVLAAMVVRKATRRIGGNGALLPHDADLLRQLDAAHRPRLHDGGRRRLCTPPPAARS